MSSIKGKWTKQSQEQVKWRSSAWAWEKAVVPDREIGRLGKHIIDAILEDGKHKLIVLSRGLSLLASYHHEPYTPNNQILLPMAG